MTPEVLNWFAAGATLTGAFVSIFKPDNPACPVNLSPQGRTIVCVVLGALQAGLQSVYGGANPITAILTAVASVATVLALHGKTAQESRSQSAKLEVVK
jgi:hypothetical protein